ncbi:DUF3221 domain-containing protein [Paenibacillus donghaensis]|uniref:DUF3221 domain-containing protein n=1 Tax=Paenibacillus donghaensis TaxID=414771 RepID=A0A2Z2K9V9_9BACL|nr:DUF3221 domain-containing protein [Paenibacillus donghaensis]ASA20285.1 hypothetical protein B9T62_05410 [Paenibacillus donghaensis]
MFQKTSTITKWTLIFVFLLLVTACSNDDKVFKGIVHTVDVENKRILVISQIKEEDLSKDYKEVLESNKYSQAIWVNKVAPSKYKKGDEIEVFFKASDDSFPAQVTAKKIVKSRIEQ